MNVHLSAKAYPFFENRLSLIEVSYCQKIHVTTFYSSNDKLDENTQSLFLLDESAHTIYATLVF